MESIKYFAPLATCIIAFVAVLTGLGFVFNLLLGPVKADVSVLKTDVAVLKTDVSVLKTDVSLLKAGLNDVNAKLDKILAKTP